MIERKAEKLIKKYLSQYPVVTVVGPRQSGKTTLCRSLFPDWGYINLEDIPLRERIKAEPEKFLRQYSEGLIIDEFQKFPELTSFIQVIVDEKRKNGLYILTGSQSFDSMMYISQSLAGRTAIFTLLPFSYEEISHLLDTEELNNIMLKGFYPKLYDQKIDFTEYYSFYVATYIERDIRSLVNIKDFGRFEKFIVLCAGRTGQELNISSLAVETGVSSETIRDWLSLLEASFVIKLIRPYHNNFNKRIVKSPKLYFLDTGLVCYLLDIQTSSQLLKHPLRGAIFETYVFSELNKFFFNRGPEKNIYFFRENNGCEVDFIIQKGENIIAIEVKSGEIPSDEMLKGLNKFRNFASVEKSILIYSGRETYTYKDTRIISWKDIHKEMEYIFNL
ncbi:MAG: ATP-binding protein [Brevinematia bacterium]